MKKFNTVLFCLVAFIILSCTSDKTYQPDGLKKLSKLELMNKAKDKTIFEISDAIFKNEQGEIIPLDSIRNLPEIDSWVTDRYVDEDNQIKELILRKGSEKDIAFQKQLIEVFQKKVPIVLIDINCDDQQNILTGIYDLDQSIRTEASTYDRKIDDQNLVSVISLIEKCGMPTLKDVNQKALSAIWLVFQHTDNENRKKYFPMLKSAAENGDLSKSQMALMEDRILMLDGKPQIYGSQITQNNETGGWMVYEIENPERVNKRRASVGLGPLHEYVSNWDLTFDVEQIE